MEHERIITTHPKAKATQRIAERLITLTKLPSIPHWTRANSILRSPALTNKLFDTLGPRYVHRPGGYSRVMHLRERRGDNAPMSLLELVDREGEVRPARVVDEEYATERGQYLLDNEVLRRDIAFIPELDKK